MKRWWLWTGLAGYALVVAVSAAQTMLPGEPLINALGVLDWLAACVIYFFIAAALGFGVERFVRRKRLRVPEWLWPLGGLWLASVLAAFVFAWPDSAGKAFLYLFFPVVYGAFFTLFAWDALFPTFVRTAYGQALLDVAYLAAFGVWLALAVRDRHALVRRVLLGVVFGVLTVGMVGCAASLA